MTIKNKRAIITGSYNNDFYAEECFNSNIGYDTIKDLVKERFPIGKEVYVSKVYPICAFKDYDVCPHQGNCYRIAFEKNDNVLGGQLACMVDFKIIEEGAK